MTSVLNLGGLNYQNGNPLRMEIQRINAGVVDLRKITDAQAVEINLLRAKVAVLERAVQAAAAAPKPAAAAAPAAVAAAGGGGGNLVVAE
jgi:microcystin-dependent protein